MCCTSVTPSELLRAPGMPLFLERPTDTFSFASGWVSDDNDAGDRSTARPLVKLLAAGGSCECAYAIRADGDDYIAQAPPSHGPSSGGPRSFKLSCDRRLLRIVAPESATPGLNWALGLDALRILEARRGSQSIEIDWLISIDKDDEEDICERMECGVRGEFFRRQDRQRSPLSIERLDVGIGSGVSLVLPEVCRIAVSTPGALPASTEVIWRVSPFGGRMTALDRCIGGATERPFWVTGANVADVRLLARSLPAGSVWAAHLQGKDALPSVQDVAMLREAGCGGLAMRYGDALRLGSEAVSAAMTSRAASLIAWATEAGVSLHESVGTGRG